MPRPAGARLAELKDRYDLELWPSACESRRELLGNLFVLDALDRTISQPPHSKQALDVGSGSFWYLPALSALSSADWTAVELPASQRGRRKHRWHRRLNRLLAHYPSVKYREQCLTETVGRFDLITWFLPYVALDPLLSVGLPRHRFDPAGLLRHTCDLLAPNGVMIIINQGARESELQSQLFKSEQLEAEPLGELTSPFNPFRHPRYGWHMNR